MIKGKIIPIGENNAQKIKEINDFPIAIYPKIEIGLNLSDIIIAMTILTNGITLGIAETTR